MENQSECQLYVSYGRFNCSVGFVWPGRGECDPRPRGKVQEFSPASRRRLRRYLEDAVAPYRYLGTLTIPQEQMPVEEFKAAADRYFVWFQRQQIKRAAPAAAAEQSICWFLEFQKRGSPHLHFFYTTAIPWQSAARQWARTIQRPEAAATATRFEALDAIDLRAATAAYARKYALKTEQKDLPKWADGYGRFWGVRGMRDVMTATIKISLTRKWRSEVLDNYRAMMEALSSEVEAGRMRCFTWEKQRGRIYIQPYAESQPQLREPGSRSWRAAVSMFAGRMATVSPEAVSLFHTCHRTVKSLPA